MATSFKRSHACTAILTAPNPAAGPRRPTPLPETPGRSQASLGQSLVGSLLLSPGSWCSQAFVCAIQEAVSLSCVSSGGSVVGLMATSSKRAMPHPGLLHPEPLPLGHSTADWYLHKRQGSSSQVQRHPPFNKYLLKLLQILLQILKDDAVKVLQSICQQIWKTQQWTQD